MPTNKEIQQRISDLRAQMKIHNIDAFIIPGTDPHLSEYIADHWKCREWISGFDGSAGTIVVTDSEAGLWTDSRYFLQAETQLKGSEIILHKEGVPHTPSIQEYLSSELQHSSCVAIDGNLIPLSAQQDLKAQLATTHLKLTTNFFPFDAIWADRPALPNHQIFIYPEELSGESTLSKRDRILEALGQINANAMLLTALDEIAWALNIRGTDVECNPVGICYAFIAEKENIIFIDKEKLSVEAKAYFDNNNIITAPYNKVSEFLAQLPAQYNILIDPSKVNEFLYSSLSAECHHILHTSPITLMKAIKNSTEIEGFRSAMIKDGVALVKFFRWLEEHIPSGEVTEIVIAEKLLDFRSEQPLFVGESFGTIAGYNAHGAIVHYRATPESNATIRERGVLLIDSGGQYFDGTTDITRTILLGEPTVTQQRDYTLVLKGHISLSMIKFPQGTRGDQLDVLARQALWNHHMNYLHGTGHGIGHFLNVHEGPQSIRLNHNPTLLTPGMIQSNEPGLYKTDQYGIRLENLILAKEDCRTPFGTFYQFEALTLYPFDIKAINKSLLTDEEVAWLNQYHKTVYENLSPRLNFEEQTWLAEQTKTI